eukprot:546366_1
MFTIKFALSVNILICLTITVSSQCDAVIDFNTEACYAASNSTANIICCVCTAGIDSVFECADFDSPACTSEFEGAFRDCPTQAPSKVPTPAPNISTVAPSISTVAPSISTAVPSLNATTESSFENISCISIIGFAISGIVQVIIAIIVLWFVVGYLIRFYPDCVDQKIMICSVIGCLLLAFTHGCVRSFILTNVIVSDAETILELRCNGLFWHQIFIVRLGELLVHIYLLSKLQSLGVFKTGIYYFLLLLVSCTILFTTAMLPWYTVPTIESLDCDSELIMCINSTPSDAGLYEEYAIFLLVNLVTQFLLLFVFLYQFYQLCTESGCCTCGRNTFTYRILSLGMVLVFVHLSEFVYFGITEETFHAILFIIYSIVILLSFKICAENEETNDSSWCWWCCVDDKVYTSINIETQQECSDVIDDDS